MDRLDEYLMATALIQASSMQIGFAAGRARAVVTDECHWSKSRETFTDFRDKCALHAFESKMR